MKMMMMMMIVTIDCYYSGDLCQLSRSMKLIALSLLSARTINPAEGRKIQKNMIIIINKQQTTERN
jgi:hypothetical protein